MAVLDLQLIGGLVVNDMQKVNSAYEKTSKPVNFVSKSEVLHIDKNKKRAIGLLRSIGFQMPMDLLLNGSIGSISCSGGRVNII